MEYAINDKVIKDMLLEDVQEHSNMSLDEAREWVEQHGCSVVDDMWDAYTLYIQDYAAEAEE